MWFLKAIGILLAFVVMTIWISSCNKLEEKERLERQKSAESQATRAKLSSDCKAKSATLLAAARAQLEAKQPEAAAGTLYSCYFPDVRDDIYTTYRQARRLDAEAALPKTRDPATRLQTLKDIQEFSDTPQPKIDAEATALDRKLTSIAERAEKTKRKREGVSVGMSKQEVRESSWGKPRSINTSIYATHTKEQWVYGGGYLYFQDDILTSIQTRN